MTIATTYTVDVFRNQPQKSEEQKKQIEERAKKAENGAKRADMQAEHVETLARRAEFKAKNYLYTYEVKVRFAQECASLASTENDAWVQFSVAQAKANAKKAVFQAAKEVAKPKQEMVKDKRNDVKKCKNETQQRRLANDIDARDMVKKTKMELELAQLQAERVNTEVEKAKDEWNKAVSAAKKAKKIAEEAAEANVLKNKYSEEAAIAKAEAEKCKIEAELRRAEAQSKRAEAKARGAEAKAWRANDKSKAEDFAKKAITYKQEALENRKAFDIKKAEAKAQVDAKTSLKAAKKAQSFVEQQPTKTPRFYEKQHLSAPSLINRVKQVFEQIPSQVQERRNLRPSPTLCDCLMSGLAMFALKYPSLLQFDQDARLAYQKNSSDAPSKWNSITSPSEEEAQLECIRHNLQTLYQINQAPSDTYMRERLDYVDPVLIRPAFKQLFAQLQRSKELEQFSFYDGYYLLASDASQYFSSNEVHCANCCIKRHQDGHVSYYHQFMNAVIIHPNHAAVIPLCPEPIVNMVDATKNDCEQCAAERLFRNIRREHPHLSLIVAYDNLQSNGPFIQLLGELNMRYIIVVSPQGNKSLFEFLKGIELTEYTYADEKFVYKIHYMNDIPLNDTHSNLNVNFLEVWVYDANGALHYHNSWITDIKITNNNAFCLYQGGRVRWKIENETFNTLKNQGYGFEHNYGHGYTYLSTVFANLMMLAFLIDQIQQLSCGMFQSAWMAMKSKVRLWEKIRAYFFSYKIASWEQLWRALAFGIVARKLTPKLDSS
jgi:hypothetical protein